MHNSGTTVQRPGLHRVQSGGACTPCERSREPVEGGRRDVSVRSSAGQARDRLRERRVSPRAGGLLTHVFTHGAT